MKKILNIGKFVIVLGAGFFLARILFFRNGLTTVPVRQVELKDQIVQRTISTTGEIKAKKEAELSFPLNGTLSRLNVREGDIVDEGQLLASLSTSEASSRLESARQNFEATKLNKELFIENYSSNIDAVGGETEYWLEVRRHERLVDKAQADYNSIQANFSNNFIYTPFSGLVIDTFVKKGESVSINAPVIKIADPKDLIFETNIDQEDFGSLSVGQEVEIELDALEDTILNGTISKLPNYANSGSNPTFTVEIEIEENEKALLGMTGDAKIVVSSTGEEVQALLYDEVFYDVEDKPYIWTINNSGNLKRKHIKIGIEGDLYTEIKTEVNTPILVPTDRNSNVEEGYKANITNE